MKQDDSREVRCILRINNFVVEAVRVVDWEEQGVYSLQLLDVLFADG